MSKIVIAAYDVQETAGHLREQLGTGYSWKHRLQDMLRGKVHTGPILTPTALRMFKGKWRPVYGERAIARFIIEYLAYDKSARAGVPPLRVMLETDTGDTRPWMLRKLVEAGPSASAPAAMSPVTGLITAGGALPVPATVTAGTITPAAAGVAPAAL